MIYRLPTLTHNVPTFAKRIVLVDGLNIIRLEGRSRPQFTTLLSVLVGLADHAYDLLTITDANTFWELQKRRPAEAVAYHELISEFSMFFIQTTGGVPADRILLCEAGIRDALVVSCDRYRDYARQFPWINTPGRILPVQQVREHLHIGSDVCPLRRDLPELMKELRASLSWRNGDGPRAS